MSIASAVSQLGRLFLGEDFLNREFKEAGDLECQGQTGIAFPGLDRFSHAFRATNGCGSSPLKETDESCLKIPEEGTPRFGE